MPLLNRSNRRIAETMSNSLGYGCRGGPSGDETDYATEMEPLREPDAGRNKPPIAGPEMSEDGDDGGGGIDDGLLPSPEEPRPIPPRGDPEPRGRDNPFLPPRPGHIPVDVNLYATKKTVAQGMMDLALLSANANQLRYVLESRSTNMYYYVNIVLICISIALQLAVGIGLILIGRYNINRDRDVEKADKVNNVLVLGIFLITVINVFISAFGIEEAEVIPMPGGAVTI